MEDAKWSQQSQKRKAGSSTPDSLKPKKPRATAVEVTEAAEKQDAAQKSNLDRPDEMLGKKRKKSKTKSSITKTQPSTQPQSPKGSSSDASGGLKSAPFTEEPSKHSKETRWWSPEMILYEGLSPETAVKAIAVAYNVTLTGSPETSLSESPPSDLPKPSKNAEVEAKSLTRPLGTGSGLDTTEKVIDAAVRPTSSKLSNDFSDIFIDESEIAQKVKSTTDTLKLGTKASLGDFCLLILANSSPDTLVVEQPKTVSEISVDGALPQMDGSMSAESFYDVPNGMKSPEDTTQTLLGGLEAALNNIKDGRANTKKIRTSDPFISNRVPREQFKSRIMRFVESHPLGHEERTMMAEAPSRFSPKTLSRFNSMLSLCESNEQVELAHQMIQQQVADLSKDAKDSRVRVGPQEASQVKKGGDTNSKDASFEAKQNQEQEQEHQKRAQALLKGARARKGGSHPPKNKIDSYRPSNLNRHREHRDEIRDRPVKGDSGEKHGSGPKHGDGKQQGAGSSKYTAKGEKHSHEGRSSGGKPYGVVKKGRTGSH